ncbi:glycosyltransferase family 4 protein [Acinetobacter portensis]|uniref:glycosyltransferase family 4 protein n=1 Tax=Acinetobacter portensis TaxID=1839785 RepID=UPI0013D13BAF|nr:glycosyltransferase family 1 protein [Acinetobacter portensis]
MTTIDTALLKQPIIFEKNHFYFKKKERVSITHPFLEDLVRPRLRIAIVTETWPPEINGVALSLLQLCKGLQKQGHKILLIRPEQKKSCEEFQPNQECLVKAQSIPKYPHLQFGWPQLNKVLQAIEKFAPNVVHIVTEGPLGFTALRVAKAKKLPISSGFHSSFHDFSRFFDLAFLLKPIQHYLRWFHNNTNVTCVPSVDTEKTLREFGVKCPLVVVGRGVDTIRFSPEFRSAELRAKWGASDETRVMISVGRLSPEKETDVAIYAFQSMKKTEKYPSKLVIVGDGPDRQRLESVIDYEDVIFTGSLSGKQLSEAYASADVFIFPSQVETFGNVVLEAMASGLPVIAYDYACAHLHVSHGTTGWLSELGRSVDFFKNVQNLPQRSELAEMGKEARKMVKNIGWNHPVQQFEQVLYAVVKETQMTS